MRDFTKGGITAHVIAFSMPQLLGNFLQSFSSIVGAMLVGHLIGSTALAAISSVMPLIFLLAAFLIGMSIATTILVSHAYGANNIDFLKKVLVNSLVASTGVAIVITIASMVSSHFLISLIRVPDDVHDEAELFFLISSGGLLIQFAFNWLSGMLRGLGDAKTPLRFLIVSTILTVALVPLFIVVFHMGIAGAAYGQIVANLIATVWGYFYTSRRNSLFDMRRWAFIWDWEVIGKIVGIGIPASLQMMVASLSGAMIIALVNRYGSDMTAAYGIGMQIDQIAFMPAMTIGMAISSMVGQNLAVKQFDRVKKILFVSLWLSVGLSAIMFLLVKVAPAVVAGLFTNDTIVIEHAARYWHIAAWAYLTYAVMFALQGVVRGAGDTMVLLIFSVIALIGVRIPLAEYLSNHCGLAENGIWWSLVISTIIGVALSFGYYLSGRWKRKLIVPHGGRGATKDAMVEEEEIAEANV